MRPRRRAEGRCEVTCLMGQSAPVAAGAQALPIWCDACGARVELVLPVGIDALAVLAGAFERRHARCRKDDEHDTSEEGDDDG